MDNIRDRIRELSVRLRRHEHEYYVLSRPGLSDLEYDRLFDELAGLEKEHPELKMPDSPTQRVGSDISQDLPEAEHTIQVLSLDKLISPEELREWMKKSEAAFGNKLSFVLEEKIDGVSVVLYYRDGLLDRALTRGNGSIGNDITANIKTIGSVPLSLPKKINAAVRCEAFLPIRYFNEINASMDIPYANPRNLAAGTLRRVISSRTAGVLLDIFAYEGYFDYELQTHMEILNELRELNFKLSPNISLFTGSGLENEIPSKSSGLKEYRLDEIGKEISRITALRNTLDYEIDGLVLKVNEIEARKILGVTGHHPRWAMAYKFESPEGITVVLSIDIQAGRTGRITPVARVKPVRISGSTVSNVTLHNQDYIDMLELAIGDTVAVSKRGDIIPAVERVIDKNETGNTTWKIPEACPFCGNTLEKTGAHHFCKNINCSEQVKGRLHFFTSRGGMDIENLGPETINTLIENKIIRDIPDIYSLNPESLSGLQGFGSKKISLIMEGIEKSKKKPFRSVLLSLGIPELGKIGVEILVDAGFRDIDSLMETADSGNIEKLKSIHGIGEKTAALIISELSKPEIKNRIEKLKKAGLIFSESESPFKDNVEPVFEGQVWCVTGSFDRFKPREMAIDEIKKRKGAVTTVISGKTTHLLAGENPGSKLEKAESLKIHIVNEKDFLALIDKNS